MMTPVLELEGTWDEIKSQVPDYNGKKLHVTVRITETNLSEPVQSIDDTLENIWRTVPDSSWNRFPTDFGDNLDQYLYGSVKSE